jgi:hypothetical protein
MHTPVRCCTIIEPPPDTPQLLEIIQSAVLTDTPYFDKLGKDVDSQD